jgi:hypothetical protein
MPATKRDVASILVPRPTVEEFHALRDRLSAHFGRKVMLHEALRIAVRAVDVDRAQDSGVR